MTDDMQQVQSDIAFLKAMAEGGRDGTETGAVILMAAGGLYGLAAAVQWAALSRFAGVTATTSTIAWMAALVLFVVALVWTKRRQTAFGGSSRAATLGWQSAGWALFVLFLALTIATWRTQSMLLISFSPTIVMALYGGAWSVAASVTRRTGLWVLAFGSFAAALVSAWLVADTIQWLFYALCLFLLAFLPGLLFMTRGRDAAASAA